MTLTEADVLPTKRPWGARTWDWLERHSTWLLAAMLVLYAVVFTLAAVRKYQLFRMGYDVALIQQAVWNTTQGRFLETHAYDFTNSLLGTDSFFMAAWLAPLYAIFPSVYTLFAAEMSIVALGALPLYLLARDRLGRVPGLLVTAIYFLYLPVEYGSLYEIRFRIMAMAWLAFLFLFVERGKYWALWPFLFLALSCRLDTTIAVAMLGIYAFLRHKPWYYGLTLLAAGIGWYLVMTQAIIPSLSTQAGYMFLEHYEPLGSTPAEILSNGVTHPLLVLQIVFAESRKLWYLFQMGAPLLFLPVLSLPVLVPALLLFLLNLLSNRPIQWDIYHHYQGPLTAFLMVGTILAWERLSRWAGWRSRSSPTDPSPAGGKEPASASSRKPGLFASRSLLASTSTPEAAHPCGAAAADKSPRLRWGKDPSESCHPSPPPPTPSPSPVAGVGQGAGGEGEGHKRPNFMAREPGQGWWRRLGQEGRLRLIGLLLLAASLACNLAFRNPLPSIFLGHAPARLETARALIARIPPDVPVAASNLLAPQVPVRRDIFLVPGGDFHYAAHPEERADYVLLDLQGEYAVSETALLEDLLNRPDWRLEAQQDGYALLVREKASARPTDAQGAGFLWENP
jgi:uncharacterized membrane protein